MNSVEFIGNVGDKPEPKATENGKMYVKFPIGIYNGKENTMWLDIVCWDDLADKFHENVQKGYKVHVKGRFDCYTYEGKDGKKHKYFSVAADWFRYWPPREQKTTTEEVAASRAEYDKKNPF